MDSTDERSASPPSNRLIIALLMAAALLPYARTLGFGYVMDDTTVIRANPDVHGWSSLIKVWAQPYGGSGSPESGLYRPLLMALFALVWNAGGHWAVWFHVLAVAMHMVMTVMVWRLLASGVSRWPAVLAALWFAVHPVHLEAVANIANSSEVLVAFWTCALALYLARGDVRNGRLSWPYAAGAGALYLAAFLTKESGAVAPLLAALWLWRWRQGHASTAGSDGILSTARRWLPVLAAWGAAALVAFVLRGFVLGNPLTGASIAAPGLSDLSAPQRIWAMLSLGPMIFRLLVWPSAPNPHYGPTALAHTGADWWAAATLGIVVIVIWATAWLAARGDRRPLAAVGWTIVAFLPASNLLVATGQILSERTLYVPSIGVAMLIGLMLQAAWPLPEAARAKRAVRAAVAAFAVFVIVVFAVRAARSSEVWRDHSRLFAQMIAADSAGHRGYWLSGLEARYRGRSDEAIAQLARAHALYPRDPALLIDYAETLSQAGETGRAASVAAELMTLPKLRGNPRAVTFYLDALEKAYGPDSVVSAVRRLMADPTPRADSVLRDRLTRTQRIAR